MEHRLEIIRKTAIERSTNWWYCDNIVNHRGEVGLLHMGFPRVFILIRDYSECYFASFEEFKDHLAEVNFFSPADREEADTESLLIDAWNFMALQEEMDEEIAEESNSEIY